MMNYSEALEYIHAIPKFVRPLGNAQLSKLLSLLGEPQRRLKFIHIAGTNGKGSVSAMTAEILKRSGYRTGLFTSPYLEVFNERIRINGNNILDDHLADITSRVRNVMEDSGLTVSEFAFITAAALLYFYEQKCDFVVLEAGMGGRLDATNVIDESMVSVICRIGLDHTQYLGGTKGEIAYEKCGIIRKKGTVVSYPDEDIAAVIKKCAEDAGAVLVFAGRAEKTEKGFIYGGKEYELSLRGGYQAQNAALVCEVIRALRKKGVCIPDGALRSGFKNTVWRARFEFISENLIIDGAHNIDGITALGKDLEDLGRGIILVIAMMEDKAYEECIRIIAPVSEHIYATELNMPRCLKAEKAAEIARRAGTEATVIKDPAEAVRRALDSADGRAVCVCGSLYLCGEVIRRL